MTDKYEKPSWIATGIAIGIWISVFVVACTKCASAQSGGELWPYSSTSTISIYDTVRVKYDTIPVDLIYRTKYNQTGWVRGWEVRKGDSVRMPASGVVDNFWKITYWSNKKEAISLHIKYLQSDRRPFPKGTRVARIEGVKEY